MSLRAVSVMVLGPLILTVGAVLVLTPKDILRQPVTTATLTTGTTLPDRPAPAPEVAQAETDQPAQPERAAVISLSDLAPSLEPVPTVPAAVEAVAEPEPEQPPADRRWIAASGGLNLRGGPGVDNRLIVSLPYGTSVAVVETSGTWAKVETAEYSGWLSLNFLTNEKPGGVN